MSPLSPERPTVLLAEGESAFQNALLFGANLHVSPYYRYPTTDPLPEEALQLFKAYNPLLEFLRGRRWVYAPNPLEVFWNAPTVYHGFLDQASETPRIKANIFMDADDNYIISIGGVSKGMMIKEDFLNDVNVSVSIPGISQYETAIVMGADYNGYHTLKPNVLHDGAIKLMLPKHGVASMVVLTKDFERLKGKRDWLKFRETAL
jgi:hypothetical protein